MAASILSLAFILKSPSFLKANRLPHAFKVLPGGAFDFYLFY
jgi:hypothetical protein